MVLLHALEAAHESEKFDYRHMGVERDVFRYIADVPSRLQTLFHDVEAGNAGAPGGRVEVSGEHAQDGALARTVRSEQAEYLAGADFVRWYLQNHPGAMPFAAAMPVSSEQILHPERYAAGDIPTEITFAGSASDTVRYEDGLGEFETRLLFQELLPDSSGLRAAALAAGWDGDRYRVIRSGPGADALVWYSVWDDAESAGRFARSLERVWHNRRTVTPASRRTEIVSLTIDGRPVVRLVDAPPDWSGWSGIPTVRIE